MIVTAYNGNNAELFANIFSLYCSEGSSIADVTYGRGVFWKNIDKSKYNVLESDLLTGTDFRVLPYESKSLDTLILDPPYMHGGKTVKESINKCYKNENGSHSSVIRLYAAGILEAARVLKQNGYAFVKSQDEIESGKQRFSHIEITQLLEIFGFEVVDLFCLISSAVPCLREKAQKHARKNHSYVLIGRFRG